MCNLRLAHRALAVALALALCAPASAAAGTFHVYGLGMNGAGCPNGWQAQTSSPAKFVQANHCSSWTIKTNRDGRALGYGEFATLSMFAGEGARFTGFSIRSTGTARNGTVWNMAMCRTAFSGCQTSFPQSGTWYEADFQLGNVVPGIAPYYAQHIYAGAACQASSCADSDAARRAVNVTHTQSHAIVEDFSPPGAPSLSGVSTGWNAGLKRLTYSASDAGSGIADATLTIDGSLQKQNVLACTRVPTGGYSQSVPCATSTGGEFALNQPGELADGHHSLTVAVRDASGETASASQDFLVDNNAPAAPRDLAVEGGDGWRAGNSFDLTWANADQGSGSPVAAAYYKIGAAPTGPSDGVRVSGDGLNRLDGIRVPREGDHAIYVWLEDAAGNKDHRLAATARLRLDTERPDVAFAAARDQTSPAEVRAHTSDVTSGVAGGEIAIRRRGTPDWHSLETRLEGSDLVAFVPDDRLERGTYEMRATAVDLAGNTATTTARQGGAPMVVQLPLREYTRVTAVLARRARGARPARARLRVPYRRAAWVRGSLRSADGPLPATRLVVYTRRLGARRWRQRAELRTSARGRYAFRLRPGTSRDVLVRYPGDSKLHPARAIARLRVRARASLSLRPSRLRRGGRIAFVGRVGRFATRIPRGGKLVQIQYLDGRQWRPAVKLARTDRRGRFAIGYRFRRISRPTHIYFRILVPAESGWPYATGRSPVRVAYVRP